MEETDRFAALVARDEPKIPLDEAALLVAAHAYPGLAVDEWMARIDDLAEHVPPDDADALAHDLFVDRGFAGNTHDYTDPRNSFLNDVIERRLGIPITLSVLMMEVGRRRGVGLVGVGMPGHFPVRLAAAGADPAPFFGPVRRRPPPRRGRVPRAVRRRARSRSEVQHEPSRAGGPAGDPHADARQPRAHLRGA